MFCTASVYADIIKLKRGISFEGKVLEETDEMYVVELSVGVVHFRKNEIDSIDYLSDMSNDKIIKEWMPTTVQGSLSEQEHTASDIISSEIEKNVLDESIPRNEEKRQNDDLIRYQGRYITPEVYEIIQKEKDIQQRRYKFIQQQKEKTESTVSPGALLPQKPEQTKEEPFGSKFNKFSNISKNPKTNEPLGAKIKPFDDTVKTINYNEHNRSI
jgi:hypothetical protein